MKGLIVSTSVRADQAKPLAMRTLAVMPRAAVVYLKTAAERGYIHGSNYSECFYGQLAHGAGHSIVDSTECQRFLGGYGLPYDLEKDIDRVERFISNVKPGETSETSRILKAVVEWCDEDLRRRDDLERAQAAEQLIAEITEVPQLR